MTLLERINRRMLEILIANGGTVRRRAALSQAVREVARVEAIKSAALPQQTKPAAGDGGRDPEPSKTLLFARIDGIAKRLRGSEHGPASPPTQQSPAVRPNPPLRTDPAPARSSDPDNSTEPTISSSFTAGDTAFKCSTTANFPAL